MIVKIDSKNKKLKRFKILKAVFSQKHDFAVCCNETQLHIEMAECMAIGENLFKLTSKLIMSTIATYSFCFVFVCTMLPVARLCIKQKSNEKRIKKPD